MKLKDIDFTEVEKILKQYFYNAYEEWHMMKDLEKHIIRRYETRTMTILSKYMLHQIINCLTVEGCGKVLGVDCKVILNHRKISRIHQWSLK